MRRLLSELVAPKIDALARGARDDFRKACCYREEVDRVLRRHEESLRVMFERYSDGAPPGDTMCVDEWKVRPYTYHGYTCYGGTHTHFG